VQALVEAGYTTANAFAHASIDDLMAVRGITRKVAEDLLSRFPNAPTSGQPTVGIQEGRLYVLRETKPERALALFHRMVDSGWRPLYITRQHPNHVVRRQGGREIRVVWLSSALGKDQVEARNLNSLTNLVTDFANEGPRGIILLDGLEYLLINNDFARVLNFLENLTQLVALRRAALILSIDKRAFEPKELGLIERNAINLDIRLPGQQEINAVSSQERTRSG